MPGCEGRASPPKVTVSKPAEDAARSAAARPALAHRRRSRTETAALKGADWQTSTEWIDVDDSPQPRNKKTSRRPPRKSGSAPSNSHTSRRNTGSEVSRFSPQLGRIQEAVESKSTSRPSTGGSGSCKHREKSSSNRTKHRDDAPVGYRRPVKHRVGGVARRTEPVFKVNPSLLSVLSSLTGISDRSSSSNTTITQQSYDRRRGIVSRGVGDRRMPETECYYKSAALRPYNVFDYMDASSADDGHDGHDGRSIYSTTSSSSSHYEQSEAGSSELPGTPSSHSTFPSPTSTRNSSLGGSVSELRRKYDSQYATSTGSQRSARSGSLSPQTSGRRLKKVSTVGSVPEEDDEDSEGEPAVHSDEVYEERKRSSSTSSRSSRLMERPDERLQRHEDAMRQYMAQSPSGQHFIEPVYDQPRSRSTSSHESSVSARAYAQYMAIQQYQHPSPPVTQAYATAPQAMNGQVSSPERPPAPDAPNLNQRTIAGYEQLALELANSGSSVKPLYRKFEYLNHRILLHMQDELCEMEEQLRTVDEIVAQMEPSHPADAQRPPASRRGDAFGGSEMHHRRTALLGRIFMKTEQYNRALASFTSMNRDSVPAEPEHIAAYRDWLEKTAPIHEVETRFLQSNGDLVIPGKPQETATSSPTTHHNKPSTHDALTCIPIALMLPLLLFAIIPTMAGRLTVTGLIVIGSFMVVSTTKIRHLLAPNEWAVCGGAYVLLLAAIAGCIPQHHEA